MDMALFEQIKSRASSPLARFVAEALGTKSDMIRQGFYFARAPLAAAAMANPAVVTFRPSCIEISDQPGEEGRTLEIKIKKSRANAQVAMDADNLRFRDVFMTALGVQ